MDDNCAPENETCRELLADLQAFVDGELEPHRVDRLRQHAVECPPCFDIAEFQEGIKHLTGASCRESAPAELRSKVLDLLGRDD